MSEIKKQGHRHLPYTAVSFSEENMIDRAAEYYEFMNKRRSVRDFSDRAVPIAIINSIIKTAATAPSGAHKQPWTFCVISNTELKHKIRELAEEEERKNYNGRMSDRWLKDLEKIGTDDSKPFIDVAPWIIVVMKKTYDFDESENKVNNYYVNESVGIACGFLISAIHNAGLVTLTHTPSPMNFVSKALNRPENEKPYLLLPIGYALETASVPDLERKPLEQIAIYYG